MKLAFAAVLAAALLAPGLAAARGQFEVSREQAIQVLETTDVFADLYVGFVGAPSREACSFRTVLDQPDAERLFKQILARGHLAGRLYALCGLYFTDHEQFLEEIQPYRRSADSVDTYQACLMNRVPVARLVEVTDARVVRLKAPSETTEEWRRRTLVPGESQDYSFDIVGGGWPARFKEMKGCDR